MAKNQRGLDDCLTIAEDLTKLIGSKLVLHPNEINPMEPGYVYEDQVGGRFLLIKVDTEGRLTYPFGPCGMKYGDFWQAGCFAIQCFGAARTEARRQGGS